MPDPLPAATAIVSRAGATGMEVLLLRRSDHGVFGGMWVFPGGRVDDTDEGADEVAKARRAAVREAKEEAGVALDPDQLVVWSHWTPPAVFAKRYTTWFFIGEWAGDTIVLDDHEVLECRWVTPAQALAEHLSMAPPTIVTLTELAELGVSSPAELRRIGDPPAYVTRPGKAADGRLVMMWNGDAGYDDSDPDLPGPRHRLYMPKGDQPARYERSN